mmetsp:Transcript_35249/g.85300  ORF Transcript_35249/g.85300 Transcript_35249/m.85300 type:complete len:801 (+) Transcript_35249:513-2915(+)
MESQQRQPSRRRRRIRRHPRPMQKQHSTSGDTMTRILGRLFMLMMLSTSHCCAVITQWSSSSSSPATTAVESTTIRGTTTRIGAQYTAPHHAHGPPQQYEVPTLGMHNGRRRRGTSIATIDSQQQQLPQQRQTQPSPRIINGHEADPSQFPFVVVLTSKDNLKCAGSLIAPDIVLTAAHCSESFREVQVGRFNRSDDTEQYDSLIVESIHTHPQYFRNRFLDPDPHDFAVVKLFGQATIPTKTTQQDPVVKINRDESVPSPNQIMHVAGWGAVDPSYWNEQSDVLRETDAFYIPTDDCKEYVGKYMHHTIDFSKVVVDGATLCAMNFKDLSDSCRGDSGGPLVVSDIDQTVLVGVVSAGYGCANPNLPALYARVSHVQDWIRDLVCELSVNPPEDFNCPLIDSGDDDEAATENIETPPCDYTEPRGGNNQTAAATATQRDDIANNALGLVPANCFENGPFDPSIEWTNITLELQLDTRPKERGWMLRYLDDSGRGVYRTFVERPIMSFADILPWSVVKEVITVPNNREYQLVLLDSYGDGHDFYSVVDEDATGVTPLIRVVDSEGTELLSANQFQSQDDAFFSILDLTVGIPETESPTATISPSESMTPSSAPTIARPSIIVIIRFGNVPQNIGFRLERIYDDDSVNDVAVQKKNGVIEGTRNDNENDELLEEVFPGTFPPELANGDIKVDVPLDHLSDDLPQTYRFTMTSNEGVGFSGGGGSYEVWLGEPFERRLLFSGGGDNDEFYHEASHIFVVNPFDSEFTDDVNSGSTVNLRPMSSSSVLALTLLMSVFTFLSST